jgi:hypothetical protein
VRWLVLGLTGALVLSYLVVLAVNNLGYTGMWWDETAQFWVSQGLGNYSPPFAKPRSVRDVVRMNRAENLDPGGFSLLLHFWSAYGKGLKCLRGLSFAFFLLGAASLGLLGWRLTRSAPFALAVALPRRRVYARLQGSPQAAELNRLRSVFASLCAVILGTQVLSIFASLLGAYPWDIASRWSAYLLMVSALSVIVLGAEVVAVLRVVLSGRAGVRSSEGLARRAGGAVALLVVAAGSLHAISYRQTVEGSHGTNVARQVDRLPLASLSDRSVFVAFYEVPVVRYLYEYGPYSGRSEYPGKYRFERRSEWRDNAPIDARGEGIAFVVSNLPFAKARARFPGSTLRVVGPEGSRLLAVAGTTD